MQELKLNKFNPLILEKKRLNGHAPIIVVVGKRGMGKSVLVADLLYHIRKIPAMLCMSGTEDGNGYYSQFIHNIMIHNSFNEEALQGLIKRQKSAVQKLKNSNIEPKNHPEIGVGVLMDDLAYDNKMMRNEAIKFIFFNGRHYHIPTIITFQYMMAMAPEFRTNVDYIFVCKENKNDNIKRYHEYFFGMFDKLSDFKKVLSTCTNDYGWLVLDQTSKSDRIEDQVFWYRASMDRKFKIGSPEQWLKWDRLLKKDDSEESGASYKRHTSTKSTIGEIKKLGPRKIEDTKMIGDDEEFDKNYL